MTRDKQYTAVIITGNPKFIKNNSHAEKFYIDITAYLEQLGFQVTLDPGEPFTTPPSADLWIGHSRGVDRLRFAKAGVTTLAFGSSQPGAINHPEDNTKDLKGPSDIIPNAFHYVLTTEMKQAIQNTLKFLVTV